MLGSAAFQRQTLALSSWASACKAPPFVCFLASFFPHSPRRASLGKLQDSNIPTAKAGWLRLPGPPTHANFPPVSRWCPSFCNHPLLGSSPPGQLEAATESHSSPSPRPRPEIGSQGRSALCVHSSRTVSLLNNSRLPEAQQAPPRPPASPLPSGALCGEPPRRRGHRSSRTLSATTSQFRLKPRCPRGNATERGRATASSGLGRSALDLAPHGRPPLSLTLRRPCGPQATCPLATESWRPVSRMRRLTYASRGGPLLPCARGMPPCTPR